VVSQSYGDAAAADLSYRSLAGGNNCGQSATQLRRAPPQSDCRVMRSRHALT
jgi:hypothetical protein